MNEWIRERVSRLGVGGAGIGNLYRVVEESSAHATIAAALEAGMTYVDTAPHYGFGLSEKRLGRSLSRLDSEHRVCLSTKVGRTLMPVAAGIDMSAPRQGFISPEPWESVFDYSYDGIMRSYEESRARLGRDVDVLYVHDIGRRVHGDRHADVLREFMAEGYRALRALRDTGVVGAIGLGVNEWEVCEEALTVADFDVVLLAGRYTLLEQGALESFLPLCKRRGVSVVIGGPFNSGILARGVRCGDTPKYDYERASADVIARVRAIEEVCVSHDVPLGAAALQFPLAHPQVISVIPGMSHASEVEQATRWLQTPIPAGFWSELRGRGLVNPDAALPAG